MITINQSQTNYKITLPKFSIKSFLNQFLNINKVFQVKPIQGSGSKTQYKLKTSLSYKSMLNTFETLKANKKVNIFDSERTN